MHGPPFQALLLLPGPDVLSNGQAEHGFHILERLHDIASATTLCPGLGVVHHKGAFAPGLPGLQPILEKLANDVPVLDDGIYSRHKHSDPHFASQPAGESKLDSINDQVTVLLALSGVQDYLWARRTWEN